MKILLLMALMALSCAMLGCEEGFGLRDSEVVEPTLTLRAPATPESPRQPSRMDGTIPTTPRPADTPLPANTPLSVMTPLAVLPSYTPEPTATVVPRATVTPVSSETAKAKREEYIQRCKHWALRNMKPIEYSRFEQLDPYDMTDLERVLWGSVIVRSERVDSVVSYFRHHDYGDIRFGDDHVEWCQDYWSEPLGAENMNKRNHETLRISCLIRLVRSGVETEDRAEKEFSYSEPMSPIIVNQWIRLLNWMDIDGESLLRAEVKPRDIVERLWDVSSSGRYRASNRARNWPRQGASSVDVEWWGIEEAWTYDQVRYCKSYYPQLFFGRWVPLDDFGLDDTLMEAQGGLESSRKGDDWPDWAEESDRDIIMELDD